VTIQFRWKDAIKNVGSSFIGTSPEFEFALYTLCFYSGQEESLLQCGPYKVKMTCYTYNAGPKKYIATSFPSEAPYDEDEVSR
jgi:poly(U)-specific endoribonuclease